MTDNRRRESARIIQESLNGDLGDEVEVVFEYGSHVMGTTHRFSDVDMRYVPVHNSTWESITVLLDDVLYDLYPIHRPALERMAEWMDWWGSILGHCRMVYTRSDQARGRFDRLTERYRRLLASEERSHIIATALRLFEQIGWEYYQLTRAADRDNYPDDMSGGS